MSLYDKAVDNFKEIDQDTYQDFVKSYDCIDIMAMFTKEELTILLMKFLLDNE